MMRALVARLGSIVGRGATWVAAGALVALGAFAAPAAGQGPGDAPPQGRPGGHRRANFREAAPREAAAPAARAIDPLESEPPMRRGCAADPVAGESTDEPIAAAELAEFRDPFGRDVFVPHRAEHRLSRVLALLLGRESTAADPGYSLLVVSEWIKQEAPDLEPTHRRFVLLFDGEPLRSRVMLSGTLTPRTFPEDLRTDGPMEVWGWDEDAGVFRYYEFDRDGWVANGRSFLPEDDPGATASNRCLACHRNGVPVMKELRVPWNNWNSPESPNAYLDPTSARAWPSIAAPARPIGDAYDLEPAIKQAIGRSNRVRIARSTSRVAGEGGLVVRGLPALVAPLFEATELNLASSRDNSGLPPFGTAESPPAGATIRLPGDFFLAHTLIGNGDAGFRGLGLGIAAEFDQRLELDAALYWELVRSRGVRMAVAGAPGQAPTFRRGLDTDFAWFTPARSYVDDHLVGRLMAEGILTREFVAAAQAIDARRPTFSDDRGEVARTPGLIPDELTIPDGEPFGPGGWDHREHPLTRHVLDRLAALDPEPDGALGRFRARLDRDDPVADLEAELAGYLAELREILGDQAAEENRRAVGSLFDELLRRRAAFLADPRFRPLDETRDGAGRSRALLPNR